MSALLHRHRSRAMPSFDYLAADADGNTVQSVVFGRTAEEASAALMQQGLRVIQIKDAYSNDPLRSSEGLLPTQQTVAAAATASSVREIPRAVEVPVDPAVQQRNYVQTGLMGPLVGKVPLRD